MKGLDYLFNESLVLLNVKAETAEEAIKESADWLVNNNYVKNSFTKAIIDREKTFPTGLPTEGVGVAIPHTDSEHVLKPAVLISVLQEPVKFKMMGMPDNNVDVKIVFMLAMNKVDLQLEILQNLMNLLQSKELLLKINNCKNAEEVIKTVTEAA